MDVKVCSTEDLVILSRRATSKRFNRAVTEEFIENLDPDGKHVISRMLAFMNDGDVHRCEVLAKMKGTHEPVRVFLDIEDASYSKLLDV